MIECFKIGGVEYGDDQYFHVGMSKEESEHIEFPESSFPYYKAPDGNFIFNNFFFMDLPPSGEEKACLIRSECLLLLSALCSEKPFNKIKEIIGGNTILQSSLLSIELIYYIDGVKWNYFALLTPSGFTEQTLGYYTIDGEFSILDKLKELSPECIMAPKSKNLGLRSASISPNVISFFYDPMIMLSAYKSNSYKTLVEDKMTLYKLVAKAADILRQSPHLKSIMVNMLSIIAIEDSFSSTGVNIIGLEPSQSPGSSAGLEVIDSNNKTKDISLYLDSNDISSHQIALAICCFVACCSDESYVLIIHNMDSLFTDFRSEEKFANMSKLFNYLFEVNKKLYKGEDNGLLQTIITFNDPNNASKINAPGSLPSRQK